MKPTNPRPVVLEAAGVSLAAAGVDDSGAAGPDADGVGASDEEEAEEEADEGDGGSGAVAGVGLAAVFVAGDCFSSSIRSGTAAAMVSGARSTAVDVDWEVVFASSSAGGRAIVSAPGVMPSS